MLPSGYQTGILSFIVIAEFLFVHHMNRSETLSIKCGVPQGSIFGPLLFIIYMNVIYNVSELLYTIMYADDTSVIMSGNDLESLIQ